MSDLSRFEVCWTGSQAEKNGLVARALGGELLPDGRVRWRDGEEGPLPDYCNDLHAAQAAMDLAWGLMEENAPVRLTCAIERKASEGGRGCRVEWWLDEGEHFVTPFFSQEAESRAFAAYVFARLEAGEGG